MHTIDFSRSFMTWRVDTLKKPPKTVTHALPYTLNNARVLIDCVCRIDEIATGHSQDFFLGASCKSEVVSVERDIWTVPNSDFVPVVTTERFMSVKTFDHADRKVMLYPPELGYQPEKQIVSVEETFDKLTLHVPRVEGELLGETMQVVQAVFDQRPLVARTVLTNDRYRATLEFPIQTMNASEREKFYQTDTGPILSPDLTCDPADLMINLDLAFVAINRPTHAEFLVRVKTPIDHGIRVWHYSKPVFVEAATEIYALP